jgi:hypothetical protein
MIKANYAHDEMSDVTVDGWMLAGLSGGLPLWRCIGCGVFRNAHVFGTSYCTVEPTTEQRLVAAFNAATEAEAEATR